MTAAAADRPTVGLLLLAGDTWWEMGVCEAKTGRYAGFMDKVEKDSRNIRTALEKSFRVVTSGSDSDKRILGYPFNRSRGLGGDHVSGQLPG